MVGKVVKVFNHDLFEHLQVRDHDKGLWSNVEPVKELSCTLYIE